MNTTQKVRVLKILLGVLQQEKASGAPAGADSEVEEKIDTILGILEVSLQPVADSSVEDGAALSATDILQVILQILQELLGGSAAITPNAKPCSEGGKKHTSIVIEPRVTGDSFTAGYDSLGRLTGLTFANGTTVAYNYVDNLGNRSSVVNTCGGSGC